MPQRPNIINSRTAAVRGGGSGASGQQQIRDRMWGNVVKAPANEAAPMFVSIPQLNAATSYEVPAGHWMPRGTGIPAEGDRCLLVFDNSGDVWCPVWVGSSSLAAQLITFESEIATLETKVPALEPGTWTNFAYGTAWESSGYQTPQVRKEAGAARLRGNIKVKTGGYTGGATVLTLPEHFRPPGTVELTTMGYNAGTTLYSLEILATGVAALGATLPANASLSLDGLTFNLT